MASDLYSFKVVTSSATPAEQLAFPDWFGPSRLAKRMKVAVGKAKPPVMIEMLRAAMRPMTLSQRRGLLIHRNAKTMEYQPHLYFELARAMGVSFTPDQKIKPPFLDALQEALAGLDGPSLAKVLESSWRYRNHSVSVELWTLHMLLHELEGETLPPPTTALLKLDVEAIHPDASIPPSNVEKSIRELAVRLLGFLQYGGLIEQQLAGTDVIDPMTIPFEVVMTDRKPRSASIHILTSQKAAEPYAEGIAERSTAW